MDEQKKIEYPASIKEADRLIIEIGKLLGITPGGMLFSAKEIKEDDRKLVEFLHCSVVHIKYLLFEIEATRREYEELVKHRQRGD